MAEIEIDVKDGIQTIRINRPEKKNALTAAMYDELAKALNQAGEDDDIRVSLLLGVPGAFTSGNDIGDFLKIAQASMQADASGKTREHDDYVFQFLEAIIMSKKTVIAGVDGLAIGVGVTMLMHCDYVICSDQSLFKTPFVDLGLLPEAGSSLLAPRLMGHHKAFELLAMGRSFSSKDARAAGFVNQITSDKELEETAFATATEIAARPKEALAISRNLIRGDRSDILARMREEAELWKERLASDEARAAFMAFMQKGQKEQKSKG